MPSRSVLGLDIDGVIANTNLSIVTYLNDTLGTSYTYEGTFSHDLAKSFGLSDEVMQQHFDAFATEERMLSLSMVEQAAESIELLAQDYRLIIITSRPVSWQTATETWLGNHGLGELEVLYTNGHNNRLAGGAGRVTKQLAAEQAGAIALIEDNEYEFHVWNSTRVELICLAQPWNASLIETHSHIYRTDWPGIVERFCG